MTHSSNGKFIISLDFELMWGVHDVREIEEYGDNIKNVHKVLPKLLSIFEEFDIRATFATVGFLFAKNSDDLAKFIPEIKPNYTYPQFSPYSSYLQDKCTEENEEYHFCNDLIKLIQSIDCHEISTHTFSHYYCLEDGQTVAEFEKDIESAIRIAKRDNVELKSIVFPRDQYSNEYLKICKSNGILSYRGNEKAKFYQMVKEADISLKNRALRFGDAYFNLSGHNTYKPKATEDNLPLNLPSSRFLRPYSKRLKFFEKRKLNRIKNSMTYAAKNNEVFHLWWHPHNFGADTEENFMQLAEILEHYSELKTKFNFESITMKGLTERTLKTSENV